MLSIIPGVRKKRVPLANLLPPLRGEMSKLQPAVIDRRYRGAPKYFILF